MNENITVRHSVRQWWLWQGHMITKHPHIHPNCGHFSKYQPGNIDRNIWEIKYKKMGKPCYCTCHGMLFVLADSPFTILNFSLPFTTLGSCSWLIRFFNLIFPLLPQEVVFSNLLNGIDILIIEAVHCNVWKNCKVCNI